MTDTGIGGVIILLVAIGLLYAGGNALIEASGYTTTGGIFAGSDVPDNGSNRWQ